MNFAAHGLWSKTVLAFTPNDAILWTYKRAAIRTSIPFSTFSSLLPLQQRRIYYGMIGIDSDLETAATPTPHEFWPE